MLVGREAERRSLGQLVSAARVGRSGALLLLGEAGIGKTALLEYAVHEADGMRVLRAVGTAPERDVAFGGLLQLLRPALDMLDQIPPPQAEALAAALAIRDGQPGDRFAIGAATLSLLSRCAEDAPLLLLLDDAHELDTPSVEALVFAARRLLTDPVALLAAARPGVGDGGPLAALPVHEVPGLDLEDAGRLLVHGFEGGAAVPDLVRRLHLATAGNPLAMLELAADTDTLATLTPEVPVPVPDVLAGSFGRRLAHLGEETRRLLLLAALADGDLTVVAQAARVLGLDPAPLGAAQDAGLVVVTAGAIQFRHPMVRSSVYAAAPVALRRTAHRAVAKALPAGDIERRTWHLAEAAVGFDDDLAEELDVVAQRARNRRAFAVAATALERAAVLSSPGARRAARLVAAGESAWWAGQVDRALGLLERGARGDDPRLAATAAGLRGSIGAHTGSVDLARRELVDAARCLGPNDPDTAVRLLTDAVQACFWMAEVPEAVKISAALDEVASRQVSEESRLLADLATGMTGVLAGRPGIGAVRRAVARLAADPTAWPDDPLRIQLCLMGVLFVREGGSGRELLAGIEADLRSRAVLGTLPGLLFHTARDEATADRWHSALTRYEESIGLARETGQSTHLTMSLAGLAWLQARMGREDSSRDLAAEARRLAERHHVHVAALWVDHALGDLELVLGRVDLALGHYEKLQARLSDLHVLDVDLVPGPELVECRLRAGETEAAQRAAAEYHHRAEQKGQPWARARAQRAMAMVAGPDNAAPLFERALELHRLNPDVFEEARTQLAYASLVRRDRRRVAARPLLRSAVATFERLGAAPWAELARQELAATGESRSPGGGSPMSRLTGQELQISRMLASGRTTREAAAALFLSPKTVEYHLRHVYTKLDIHSRTELAEVLGEETAGG